MKTVTRRYSTQRSAGNDQKVMAMDWLTHLYNNPLLNLSESFRFKYQSK